MKLLHISDRIHDIGEQLDNITSVELGSIAPDVLVDAIAEFDRAAAQAKLIRSLLATALINDYGPGSDVDGTEHVAEIRNRASKRVSDNARALPIAVDLMCDNKIANADTGEIETDREAIVRQLPDLVPLTPSVGLKATGAKALGLDLDKYRDTEWGQPVVKLVKRDDSDEVAA